MDADAPKVLTLPVPEDGLYIVHVSSDGPTSLDVGTGDRLAHAESDERSVTLVQLKRGDTIRATGAPRRMTAHLIRE